MEYIQTKVSPYEKKTSLFLILPPEVLWHVLSISPRRTFEQWLGSQAYSVHEDNPFVNVYLEQNYPIINSLLGKYEHIWNQYEPLVVINRLELIYQMDTCSDSEIKRLYDGDTTTSSTDININNNLIEWFKLLWLSEVVKMIDRENFKANYHQFYDLARNRSSGEILLILSMDKLNPYYVDDWASRLKHIIVDEESLDVVITEKIKDGIVNKTKGEKKDGRMGLQLFIENIITILRSMVHYLG